MFTRLSLNEINRQFASFTAEERLAWTYDTFGADQLVVSSSFGVYSAALLHLISRVAPSSEVVFLDTNFHFRETLAFALQLTDRLGLRLVIRRPSITPYALQRELGPEPYQTNADRCCELNKVLPMRQVLAGRSAWISGVRRGQTNYRAGLEFVSLNGDDVYNVHPLLDWSKAQLQQCLEKHRLPSHPLAEAGYASIGCWPCTRKPARPDDDRSGRWDGQAKTECGLHLM